MSSTNGHTPNPAPPVSDSPPTSRRAALRAATPLCTKIAMTMLWIAVIDRDDAAIERALALLPDDTEVRGIAVGMARIAVSVEPRLRCDAARASLLDLLETYDLSHRAVTGRL